MDDFRRLDDFSDSTDDPFGSPLGRREPQTVRREPSASVAKAWHRAVGVLLLLGIGGGSLALLLSILVVNLLPAVLVCVVLLLASSVIAFRFRHSAPDLTATRLIWRVTDPPQVSCRPLPGNDCGSQSAQTISGMQALVACTKVTSNQVSDKHGARKREGFRSWSTFPRADLEVGQQPLCRPTSK